MKPNQEFNNMLRAIGSPSTPSWSGSWGPTPDMWYSSDDWNILNEQSGNYPDAIFDGSGSFNYTMQKNSINVLSTTYPKAIISTKSSGSGTTTRFLVARIPTQSWTTQDIWNYTYRASSGVTYNMASITIDTSNNIYIGAHYTNNSGSTNTRITSYGTYSNNEWCIIVHKCKASLSQTNTGTINGRSMTSTTALNVGYSSLSTDGYSQNVINTSVIGGNVIIGELILYNSTLSSGNTTLVENYLKSKWGISY